MKENVNKDTANQNKTSTPALQQSQDNIARRGQSSQMGSDRSPRERDRPQQGDPSLND